MACKSAQILKFIPWSASIVELETQMNLFPEFSVAIASIFLAIFSLQQRAVTRTFPYHLCYSSFSNFMQRLIFSLQKNQEAATSLNEGNARCFRNLDDFFEQHGVFPLRDLPPKSLHLWFIIRHVQVEGSNPSFFRLSNVAVKISWTASWPRLMSCKAFIYDQLFLFRCAVEELLSSHNSSQSTL